MRYYRNIRFANDPDWERSMKMITDTYKLNQSVGLKLHEAELVIARLSKQDSYATREAIVAVQKAQEKYKALASAILGVKSIVKEIQ